MRWSAAMRASNAVPGGLADGPLLDVRGRLVVGRGLGRVEGLVRVDDVIAIHASSMRDRRVRVQSRGARGAAAPPERMPGWHTTSRRPTRTTTPTSMGTTTLTTTGGPGRRRERPGGPGLRRPRRRARAGRRLPRGVCRHAARRGRRAVRAPRLHQRLARVADERPVARPPAPRRLCGRAGRRPRRGRARRPTPTGRRRPSCSCWPCTRRRAGRATARACSTPRSTPPAGATATCWPRGCSPADDRTRAFLTAAGLEADGAHRERVVDAEGTTAREVRLSAGLAADVD